MIALSLTLLTPPLPGAPLLYMILCIPLGFAVPALENSYGYEQTGQNGTTTAM